MDVCDASTRHARTVDFPYAMGAQTTGVMGRLEHSFVCCFGGIRWLGIGAGNPSSRIRAGASDRLFVECERYGIRAAEAWPLRGLQAPRCCSGTSGTRGSWTCRFPGPVVGKSHATYVCCPRRDPPHRNSPEPEKAGQIRRTSAARIEGLLDRLRQAGIPVVSTVQILSEMVDNWAEGAGPKIMPVLAEIYEQLG